jgi:hypothetical protein
VNSEPRIALGISFAGVLLLSAYLLIGSGVYGLSLFTVLPVALGGLGAWVADAKTEGQASLAGVIASGLGSLLFLLIGWEGVICILMAAPIILPLGGLGGFVAWTFALRKNSVKRAGLLLFLPPLTLAWDMNASNPVFEVRTAIEIDAPAEEVWKNVVSFSDLPEPDEWFFKAGLAYPKRARIEGSGVHAMRYCEFSTGPFVEPIEVWDEPRLLSFRVTSNPPPMEEWSPYRKVTPRHLHGYLVSKKGQFKLTPLPGNRTLLEGSTWYQHGLRPVEYWRWWSDAVIHRIHLRVLNHIKGLSES